MKKSYFFYKRLFDISFALFVLLFVFPIILGAVVWVLMISGFPVFFTQDRVGRKGKVFKIYKIRTMRKNAEKSGTTTHLNDDRVYSGVGILRKYKIDELPQLLNVLKGDMSIVGPRPTVQSDFELMNSKQKDRVGVKPGLTGLAQVNGNTNLSWPERIEYDLAYIKNLSFFNDLSIILQTVSLLVRSRIDSNPSKGGEW